MWDFSVVDNGIISEDRCGYGGYGELDMVELRIYLT